MADSCALLSAGAMFSDQVVKRMIAVESEGYDSGVPTDCDSRSQKRTFSSQKEDLSDYGTDCSSPEIGRVRSEKESPCEAKGQVTTMGLRQEAEERLGHSTNKGLQDKSHTVTCTVTICFAIPSPPKKEDFVCNADHKAKGNSKHHKKVIEAPKAQKYFHFEYFLLPEDTEPTKVDVVMFGVVAKLYMEQETRLLKPWQENEKIWLTWSHSVELCVTKEVLLKALKHQICVKMWSTKDKVSAKARFDRPKAFRVSTVKQGDDPEVKQLILNQRKLFEESLPRQSFVLDKNGNLMHQDDYNAQALNCAKKLPPSVVQDAGTSSTEQDHSLTRLEMSNTGLSVVAQSEKPPTGQTGKRKSARSWTDMKADLQKLQLNIQSSKDQKIEASPTKREHGALYHLKHSDIVIADKVRLKSETEKDDNAPSARSLPADRKCLTLSMNFMPILAGDLYVTSRLQESSHQILDCYVTMALNSPLLSDQQRRDLNPLVIRILSAKCLPSSPMPISVLQEKCIPVYCKYRFQDHPSHRTHGQTQGTHVFFRDVNVVFVGIMSPGKLREFLLGPPIEIEVHDRDQKVQECMNKPSLFGMEPEDEKLSNVGLVTSKSTVHDPFMQRDRLPDPYGIAKIRLSELVYGATYLNLSIPIHGCESPDAAEYHSCSKSGGRNGSVNDGQVSPLQVGHYLDAQSQLKVRLDLAVPLTVETVAPDCPFGRIIYVFDYKNRELFQNLIKKITEINCRALSLDPDPKNPSLDVVSRVCLTDDQKSDTSLDIITGIHIMDGDIHLFILEGLRQCAVRELWETLPSRLDYICSAKKLRDVIQSDLLPSVEMIQLLSREFGVPLKPGDLLVDAEHGFSQNLVISEKVDKTLKCHLYAPLDNVNEPYIQFKRENENHETKDHIQVNIDRVWHMSRELKKPKVEYVEIVPVDGMAVHNYSSQTLNSSDLALKILRQKMAMEPNHRYSYSLDYMSATVSPVDTVQEMKKQVAKSRDEWMTPSGFLYPGFRSSIESNMHPKKPDDARILELTKVWKENILHANTLQPTLSRDHWRWADRHIDFDLYKKPRERGSLSAPVTVHVTDETLKEETIGTVQAADLKQDMRVHRCLPQTELTARGPHASNQLSRLQDLLKDKEAKLSLRRTGLALMPIPALAVIPKSESDGNKIRNDGKGFIPGELKDHSLKWTDNVIPCHNMNHETFRKLRGKDFTSISTDHSFNYKRKIKELSKDEKNSFTLLKSEVKGKSSPKMADDCRKVVQIQSHEGFLLHIQ
ncbi:hypothetical protein GDO81_018220 [Engystomops pustulosus]|uniref:DUF4550 domain-containing protein n=1 Tax=Engystomops pustulosus TaxID=76066 RepID=A0AAV7ABX7_ENGPU|nr:hypothetical protein GDO81_018220 [Engystomops pustulosus]